MKGIPWGRRVFQFRLGLQRWGWINAVTTSIWLLGATTALLVIPQLRHEVSEKQVQIQILNKEAHTRPLNKNVVKPPLYEQRVDEFLKTLGESRYAEQQIKTIFLLASDNGLILAKGEYKIVQEKTQDFVMYKLQLPIQGAYGSIRKFCEQVLSTIPFASIDELSMKRDNITNAELEAQIQITLYLRNQRVLSMNHHGDSAIFLNQTP